LKETDDSSIVDELKMEREKISSLERHIVELKAEFAEKEQASNQYQQFVHQLNQQLSTLATKVGNFDSSIIFCATPVPKFTMITMYFLC
jgi:chromosome segregation ATPase